MHEPVNVMLLGVSGAWWFIASLGCTDPRRTSGALVVGTVVEIAKGRPPFAYYYCQSSFCQLPPPVSLFSRGFVYKPADNQSTRDDAVSSSSTTTRGRGGE